MKKSLGIIILVICFGTSSVNVGLASQSMDLSPIVVQPYSIQALNQQTVGLDRKNRDQEIEIKELIEENNKLIQNTIKTHQQDTGLTQVNQTMLKYRDDLIARDRALIIANGEKKWDSRYGDLIALTEDADALTVQQELENKSGLLAAKYQMLTTLKDEMSALNQKLTDRQLDSFSQNKEVLDGYKKLTQEQQVKIQMLVEELGKMDKKILELNDIIAEKDQQIIRLQEDLLKTKNEVVYKDQLINEQKYQIDILQKTSKVVSSSMGQIDLSPIIVNAPIKEERPIVKEEGLPP